MTVKAQVLDDLKGAPAAGFVNPEIKGWINEEHSICICGSCAGRLIARGCSLGTYKLRPVWKDSIMNIKCLNCGKRE